MGGTVLLLYGLASGGLRAGIFQAVLRDTMAVSGALFALFVAATTFTLLFRAFGTDRLLDPVGDDGARRRDGAAIAVLVVFALSAFVLDAFEIIFVIVPIVMPPVLMRAPDAVWISVLALLCLCRRAPGAADRLCRDDGAQHRCPEDVAAAAGTRAGAPSRRPARGPGAGPAAARARPPCRAGPPRRSSGRKLDDDAARKRFNDMLSIPSATGIGHRRAGSKARSGRPYAGKTFNRYGAAAERARRPSRLLHRRTCLGRGLAPLARARYEPISSLFP